MTTIVDVLHQAQRLSTLIQRQPHGWRTYVTVQDMEPNVPKYTWANAGPVDHCGLSVNAVYAAAGLVMGRDFGDNAWTPSGYEWMRSRGRLVSYDDVKAGDSVYIRWGPYGFNVHHIEIATGPRNADGTISTIGWNVDTTGQGRYFNRPTSVIVGIGRPYGITYETPIPQPEPEPTPPPALIALLTQPQEADVAQIIDIYDPATGQVKFHMMNVGGVVSPTTGPYADEDNGFTRVRIALPDWEAREKEQLRQLDTLRRYFNEKPATTLPGRPEATQ